MFLAPGKGAVIECIAIRLRVADGYFNLANVYVNQNSLWFENSPFGLFSGPTLWLVT